MNLRLTLHSKWIVGVYDRLSKMAEICEGKDRLKRGDLLIKLRKIKNKPCKIVKKPLYHQAKKLINLRKACIAYLSCK